MLGTRDPTQLDEPRGRGPDARTLRAWLAPTGPAAAPLAPFVTQQRMASWSSLPSVVW
ncbi:MAG TPA: hypothetical protein VKP04_00965 [Ktedonobacteraceae bacterium]|nr:hypothetical protein [Ktedonobacteraceae bacterium]